METALQAAPAAALVAKREMWLSPPAWQERRQRWLGTVNVNGRTVRYTSHGIEPLTAEEIGTIEHRLRCLQKIIMPASDATRRKAEMITAMIVALAGGQLSEGTAEAKAEAYLYAIADMPEWAVMEAIKKWYRGAVRGIAESEFKWPPSPAVLLRATEDELRPYRDAIEDCNVVLKARPLEETIKNGAIE